MLLTSYPQKLFWHSSFVMSNSPFPRKSIIFKPCVWLYQNGFLRLKKPQIR